MKYDIPKIEREAVRNFALAKKLGIAEKWLTKRRTQWSNRLIRTMQKESQTA